MSLSLSFLVARGFLNYLNKPMLLLLFVCLFAVVVAVAVAVAVVVVYL